jgi:drug/metabolite transporter (DMT)-like permease
MRRLPQTFVNVGLLSLVSFFWGSQFVVYKHAADHLSDSAISFFSFVLAIIILVPFLLLERRARRQKAEVQPARPFQIGSFLLLGAAILPPSIGASWGIEHSTGSNGAILYLTLPIFMLVLSVPVLGERLTWSRVATLLLAMVGAYLVSRDDFLAGRFTTSTLLGNLAILSAVAGSALYNTYSKRVLAHYSELEVMVYSYSVAATLCAVASLLIDRSPFYEVAGIPLSTWLAIGALGSVIWGLSVVLFLWLLSRVDIGQVSISLYLQSFFGVVLSVLLLGERLRLAQIAGGLIVLASTFLAGGFHTRPEQAAERATVH